MVVLLALETECENVEGFLVLVTRVESVYHYLFQGSDEWTYEHLSNKIGKVLGIKFRENCIPPNFVFKFSLYKIIK